MGFKLGKILGGVGAVLNPVAMLGTALATGGDIFSAYSAQKAQEDANKTNKDLAYVQMGFQERMSSTAHQREVEDLRRAGLNPLLSVNSGASSPGGASATMEPSPLDLSSSVTSARESARLMSTLKTEQSTRKNIDWDTELKRERGEEVFEARKGLRLENDLLEMRNDFFKKNPWAFKLNAASGGLNSAGSLLRLLK